MSTQIDQLKLAQAAIRDEQRQRIERLHEVVHNGLHDEVRRELGQDVAVDAHKQRFEEMNQLLHAFMMGFDRAVLIHETINYLEGNDPTPYTQALWPVHSINPKNKALVEKALSHVDMLLISDQYKEVRDKFWGQALAAKQALEAVLHIPPLPTNIP